MICKIEGNMIRTDVNCGKQTDPALVVVFIVCVMLES